eukprot:m.123008 g.123008  ORF g.123008 m.123008 type:complete len:805 (+) comp13444_c0_seq1:111-2525(+)
MASVAKHLFAMLLSIVAHVAFSPMSVSANDCGPSTFTTNLTGLHCLNLTRNVSASSASACASACCQVPGCTLWQWLSTDYPDNPTPGCWHGDVMDCSRDSVDQWVGAARPTSSPITTRYTVEASDGQGRVFDGIGAISGGGGETVLLPAYPETQRTEILDYLFKPKFGAALHILKVEIGGDALSTDGAEPSHQHTEDERPNFNRGYEWFVAKEAARRNPGIKLYALPWEWPAWVGGSTLVPAYGKTGDPFNNVTRAAQYVTDWVRGASRIHSLDVDYVGIWNESPCPPKYVTALRYALDTAGFRNTRIVAPDEGQLDKNLSEAIASDPLVASSLFALGFHYPDSNVAQSTATLADAHNLPMWASEDDSTVEPTPSAPDTPRPRAQPAGGCLARTINENYVRSNITATIVWNLIMARYPQLRWDYTALISATDPLNGHYDVMPGLWAAAHTTQFTMPGWRLLKHGMGSGWLKGGGTYVGYSGPNGELTIVVEKMNANESNCQRGSRSPDELGVTVPELATFVLTGDTAGITSLSLWQSHFGTDEFSTTLFERQQDVAVTNGTVTIQILPNWVYTLSSVVGSRGNSTPPPLGQFPASYADDFENCNTSSMPKFIAPMSGAFECVPASGRRGMAVRQMSPGMAICDRGDVTPYAIIGDGFRTTYNITVDVLIPTASGGGFVGGRAKGPVGSNTGMDGVFLVLNTTHWRVALKVVDAIHPSAAIASGALTNTRAGQWQTVNLIVCGEQAHGSVNGVPLFEHVSVPPPHDHSTGTVAKHTIDLGSGGYAAIGTVGYTQVEFDSLQIKST